MAKRNVDFYCYDSALKGWTLINSREIFDNAGKALTGQGERHNQLKTEGIPLLRYWDDKGTWFVYANEDNLPEGHVVRSGLAKNKPLVIIEAPTETKTKTKTKTKSKQTRKAKAKVQANPELEALKAQLAAMQAMLEKLAA